MCWERLTDRDIEEVKGIETRDLEKPRGEEVEWPTVTTRKPVDEPVEADEELARV